MELVKKGGVAGQEKKAHEHGPKEERKIYVCDLHPESVSDKPGQCFKDS
jgi:hypothetical protein